MKTPMAYIVIMACAVLVAATVLAQTPDRTAAEKQIIANERAIITAFAKGDAAGFKSGFVPEAFGVDAGLGVTKIADWEKMMKDIKIEREDIDHTQLHWIGADTAILTYRWTGKGMSAGKPVPSVVWSSTIYVQRGGKWLVLFHQETAGIEPQPPAKK